MTINYIKKAIREIEISYDYNHSKNDYDILLNLTELANLIKTLQDKAIDDFVKYIDECSGWTQNCIEHDISLTVYTLHQIAEQLKAGAV